MPSLVIMAAELKRRSSLDCARGAPLEAARLNTSSFQCVSMCSSPPAAYEWSASRSLRMAAPGGARKAASVSTAHPHATHAVLRARQPFSPFTTVGERVACGCELGDRAW
eukprot:3013920-Rhodomonas_salina.1